MAVQLFASGEETLANMDVSIEGPVAPHSEEAPESEASTELPVQEA